MGFRFALDGEYTCRMDNMPPGLGAVFRIKINRKSGARVLITTFDSPNSQGGPSGQSNGHDGPSGNHGTPPNFQNGGGNGGPSNQGG